MNRFYCVGSRHCADIGWQQCEYCEWRVQQQDAESCEKEIQERAKQGVPALQIGRVGDI